MTEFDPAPTKLAHVIDPKWLSHMLSTRWPGTIVEKVDIVETLITQATKVRLALDVRGIAGPPTRICIKGVLSPTGVPSVASVGETLFYQTIAEHMPVRRPPCIYAELNDAKDNGVVVMEDVIAAGAVFCSALDAFTPDQARASLDQLASLHAVGWNDRPIYAPQWIPHFLDRMAQAPLLPLEKSQNLLDGRRGDALPVAIKDAARLQHGLEFLAARLRGQPACLVHGDAHAGNIYCDAQGVGLVDWQIFQKGHWSQDVAYHLAAVLTPEDRRTHEHMLLDHYRSRLRALGGPDLDAGQAREDYCAAMIYGYYLWAITQKVEPAITETFVHRLGLAVHDLRSFEAVGA